MLREKHFRELVSLFDRYGVRYLVIGGYAVIHHAQPRGTMDLDIFIGSDRANAERAFHALQAFGAPMAGLTVEDIEEPSTIFQIGQPPLRIDIIKAIEGVSFDDAFINKVEAIEDELAVNYIGSVALITNKTATGRLQDLADAEAIRNATQATQKHYEENQ